MPLTGLPWLPAAIRCDSWLHQPLRHLCHVHLLLMSLKETKYPTKAFTPRERAIGEEGL